jgi:hypothetical protein
MSAGEFGDRQIVDLSQQQFDREIRQVAGLQTDNPTADLATLSAVAKTLSSTHDLKPRSRESTLTQKRHELTAA